MDKTSLRKRMLDRRRDLPKKTVRIWDADIARQLQAVIDWPTVRTVHIYRSHPDWNEVDTKPIEAYIAATWPHITVTIGVPIKTAMIPVVSYDLIIVPLVAFDEQCNRLGFGGGWYDRFLSMQPQALKLGLAYESQRIPAVPHESHDVPLDMIVTEGTILTK